MSLETLRSDPAAASSRNVYRTGPASGSFTGAGAMVQGGRCYISCSQIKNGNDDSFFDLKATEYTGGLGDTFWQAIGTTANDYFYPWMRTGVGWVVVPKTVPNGTIVMTGGVNGCTIVVSENGANYYFYHDGDSRYLTAPMINGNVVATVRPKDYDPCDFGRSAFTGKLQASAQSGVQPMGDVSYGHFVVAVKKDNRFGLYMSGMISLNGLTRLPSATSCGGTFD